MAKYVDVEPLIEEYTKSINYVTTHATKMNIMEFANAGACFETARQMLMDAPTADVAPVRHGRWIVDDISGIVKCSECKNDAPLDTTGGGQWRSPFCHGCGAKMDGSEGVR